MIMTFRQYKTWRLRKLREEYPDSTREEREDVLAFAEQEWLSQIRSLPRDAELPLAVGRSLVALVGYPEALRTVRHIENRRLPH